MPRSPLVSLLIITLCFFVTQNLDTSNHFETQQDYNPSENTAIFRNQIITPPPLADLPTPSKVLGNTSDEKKIYVDLTNQMLYAYEGEKLIYSFLVSTGKWGRTPTGIFTIWGKFRYTKMSGGSKTLNTYYYLPNVPYVMFFSNDEIAASRGFSIHGTYWHENFGHPMSHGCVNMKTQEAGLLYNWANPTIPEDKKYVRSTLENPGTQIIIYGKTPAS